MNRKNLLRAIDASSMIHAWQNYPQQQFSKLWDWIAIAMQNKNLTTIEPIFAEISHYLDDCKQWLKKFSIHIETLNHAILQEANDIKEGLGIDGISYHPNGVS